ncbi:MAG TPA: glycosyltransferase [Rhodanobacteraceae bacterium]
MLSMLVTLALIVWLVALLLPWQPWRCRERLDADAAGAPDVSDVTVLIPARNEAEAIGTTLRTLAATDAGLPVVLVDDESDDATVAVAQACGLRHLQVVAGSTPPPGWTGKLWAMQQGLAQVTTPYVLLLDADIRLAPGLLPALRCKAEQGFALVSLCACPNGQGWAARWLLPAFVYFFKWLYPFALANRADSRVAAAAGGVVLIERQALLDVGGFAAWRDAIIDDCTLAAHVKRGGHRCWIGLTHDAVSQRRSGLADIVRMVARTAFVQLRESWWRLLAASLLLVLVFWLPLVGVACGTARIRAIGALAWLLLAISHVPVLRYYRRCLWLAPCLPLAAGVFLWATWLSAWRSLGGTRSVWKGRRYAGAASQTRE